MNAHVEIIILEFNACAWTIGNLKKIGLPACDLLKMYFSLVWPVNENVDPAFYLLLPTDQSEILERLQKF